MDVINLVTKFINSGEIQEMAHSDPKSRGAFATGATWAVCRLAELANANSTAILKYNRKHNIFYCGNCNEVIYESKSIYRNKTFCSIRAKYKYCYNCGRRFVEEETKDETNSVCYL